MSLLAELRRRNVHRAAVLSRIAAADSGSATALTSERKP